MKIKALISGMLLMLSTELLMAQSCVPRIQLHYATLSADTFSSGTMALIEDGDSIHLSVQVRRRGKSSLVYDKPAYAIKVVDTLGQKQDTALLGMRSDNYWILDAMAVDKARMRNCVSMQLWLEFSRKPWYQLQEPKMLNGFRGRMVQVFVNDSAQGIYCLEERVDRKQLKLKKYTEQSGVRGLLYKSSENKPAVEYRLRTAIVDTLPTWDGWEQQYPDAEDGEPICWSRLYNHIYACTHTANSHHADTVRQHLDMPVYIDYVLFCHLLSARDNISKNINLSFYNAQDPRALYTPWDLDHSWGRQYNSQEEPATTVAKFTNNYLYWYMYYYGHITDTLATRYAELRQHYFTVEHIDSLFAPYFDLYAETGLDTLEQRLWSGHNGIELDIQSERPYIHAWVEARLAYLDSLYRYTPPVVPTVLGKTGAAASDEDSAVRKVWISGRLYILRGRDRYDLLGRPVPGNTD